MSAVLKCGQALTIKSDGMSIAWFWFMFVYMLTISATHALICFDGWQIHRNMLKKKVCVVSWSVCVCVFCVRFSMPLSVAPLILMYSFKCGVATYFQRQRFRSMLSPIPKHSCVLWCKYGEKGMWFNTHINTNYKIASRSCK